VPAPPIGRVRGRVAATDIQLRGQSEKARLEMEKGLTDTLAREWEKMKDQVRQEWARQG
jgi:hypothetical protein